MRNPYLPQQYEQIEQAFYQGDGVHSVNSLQKICNQNKEYMHQQQIIKQEMESKILELEYVLSEAYKELSFHNWQNSTTGLLISKTILTQ